MFLWQFGQVHSGCFLSAGTPDEVCTTEPKTSVAYPEEEAVEAEDLDGEGAGTSSRGSRPVLALLQCCKWECPEDWVLTFRT